MEWQFYAEADVASLSIRPWSPSAVYVSKRLVDGDGNILSNTRTSLEDALGNCSDVPALAAEYLNVLKSHFDAQYNLIYTGRNQPHPSLAINFGNTLSSCLRIYLTLLNNDLGEI